MSARPPSSLRGRPPSSSMRGGRMATGMVPGTGRPGTRGGQVPGSSVLQSGIKVADRPMTQQGLGGMKTAGKRPQRQIQDRTYWLGEIRSKISELNSELGNITNETQRLQEENNTYLMFEKRAEMLNNEITDLQGNLHDYNTIIDRMNMSQELNEVLEDLNGIRSRNDREVESVERLLEQKSQKEKQIEKLETEITKEQNMTENKVQDMNPEMRQQYGMLRKDGVQLAQQLDNLQNELDNLNSKQQQIELNLQTNPVKQEAVQLYEHLAELKQKKEQLELEERQRNSPEKEKEELLSKVKIDNQEISTMDRQMNETDAKINKLRDELTELENELEDQQGEQTEKYRNLQKREQTIDEFMESFSNTKAEEIKQNQQMQETIVAILDQISNILSSTENLPSVKELHSMQDNLQFKEGELHKSESTSMQLAGENTRLHQELSKVEELAEKIGTEMTQLREKNDMMARELSTYSDIKTLQRNMEQKKQDLLHERQTLQEKMYNFKSTLEAMVAEYERMKLQLDENETHAQLSNLERKWQHLEQNNFALSDYIKSRSLDYKPVKVKAKRSLNQLNKQLQELYVKTSIM